MSLVDQLNHLWGGIVDSITFDVVEHRAEVAIRLPVMGGGATRYQIAFSGISDFRFTDEWLRTPGWNYAELTEIHCTFQPDESVLTRIVLWDESSQLVVHSLGIELQEVKTDPQIA